jgi:hypothetical protein
MSTAIVTVNAAIQQAPAPSNLQQRVALISQGGTTEASQSLTLISTLAALTAILSAAQALTSITWTTNVATGTTTAPHGWTSGDTINATISGATPTAYNGTFPITITGASTFTYPLLTNPGGSASVPGSVILADEAELLQMGTTYFAGNGVIAPYVLELGEGTATEGVAALTTWIGNNGGTPSDIYQFLVPREWDNNSAFLTFLALYTATNKKRYFYVTTTVANRAVYAGLKAVLAEVEAGGVNGSTTVSIGASEFSLASAFGTTATMKPGSSTPLTPLGYAPSFGTTAYPQQGNANIFTELAAANVGWIATGAEGGVATNILKQGLMADGNPWNFWYSVDWAQINFQLALANEVINGSVPGTLNPLFYNQQGINRLQNRCVQVANQASAYNLSIGLPIITQLTAAQFGINLSNGLYNGQIVINAVPFTSYTTLNPSAYAAQQYGGLSCQWIPLVGFRSIVFNMTATNLLVQS